MRWEPVVERLRAHPVSSTATLANSRVRPVRRDGVSRLIIWRHGQTEWNATDRVQGHTDVGPRRRRPRPGDFAAQRIAEEHPDVIISSDLRRAADHGQRPSPR